jgi:hypothetical protein
VPSSKRIEVSSEEVARELQRHLQDRRLPAATYDKGRRLLQFSDEMNSSQWSNLRSTVEKWAKGKDLDVAETIRLQPRQQPHSPQRAEKSAGGAGDRVDQAEIRKRVQNLSPQKAEERYNYLSSKPISELTDVEYEERLALAERSLGRKNEPKS